MYYFCEVFKFVWDCTTDGSYTEIIRCKYCNSVLQSTNVILPSQLIGKAREINNYKAFWCAEKIKNTILTYQLENKRKPKIALMGLAFKADIDDLRESPAKYIAEKIVSEFPEACLIVEPNISQHPQFQLSETGYAYRQADIIAFLVAHKEFKTLPYDNSKLILDFCGIFKK